MHGSTAEGVPINNRPGSSPILSPDDQHRQPAARASPDAATFSPSISDMASSHGGAQGVAVQRGTGQQFPPCALAVTADDIRLSVKVHQAVNRNHCRFHDCIIVGMLFANALTCVRAKLVQHQMVRCIDAGNTFSAVSTKHADIRPNVCCMYCCF